MLQKIYAPERKNVAAESEKIYEKKNMEQNQKNRTDSCSCRDHYGIRQCSGANDLAGRGKNGKEFLHQ